VPLLLSSLVLVGVTALGLVLVPTLLMGVKPLSGSTLLE
jgi:hypothetical protein